MLRRILALSAALSAMAVSPAPACSVMPSYKNIVERKAAAAVTFHGVQVKSAKGTGCNAHYLLQYFRVEKAFGVEAVKGDTLVVATPTSSAACGIDYPQGQEVVVFAGRPACNEPAGVLFSSLGSYNVEYPSKLQVDSVYGTVAVKATRPSSQKAPPKARRDGSGFAFQAPESGVDRRDAEGRALFPR